MANNTDPKRVVTGQVRLSYVHLTKPRPPRQGSNEEPKFSVTLLIPKSDVATMQRINGAIQAAIQEGTASTWGGIRPPQPALPLYDGDGVRPSGEPFGAECRGHYVITASSKQQPEIVDTNMNPIMQSTEVYSGMYARVSVRFFAYNSNGKKGIGCGLGNVQKLADGEPLAGGASAAEDFGGAPTAPAMAPQPGYPQQPNYGQYQQPMYPQQPQQPQQAQPGYTQQAQPNYQPQGYPQQPAIQPGQWPTIGFMPQQQPTQPIDPITGKPVVPGGVLGIDQK